jgi:hypothetical protein
MDGRAAECLRVDRRHSRPAGGVLRTGSAYGHGTLPLVTKGRIPVGTCRTAAAVRIAAGTAGRTRCRQTDHHRFAVDESGQRLLP